MYWLKSVTRVVFFLIAFTTCVGFISGILPVKDFMILAAMAFSFFFSIKQINPNVVTTSTSTTTVNESPTEDPEK